MYIKSEDHAYFMGLFNSLDEAGQQKLLNHLRKAGSEKAGVDISKVQIIDKAMLSEWTIDPKEMITRTMIKKAYRAAKEGK